MKKILALLLCVVLTMSLCLVLTACNDDGDIGKLPSDNEQEEPGELPEDPDDEEPIDQPEDPNGEDEEPIDQPEEPDDEDEETPVDPAEIDFDKMAVKNWSNYQSIGAGYVQTTTQQPAIFKMSKGGFAQTDNEIDSTPKLIGLTKDGVYEIISFIDTDSNETQQSFKLVAFSAYRHFTFVTYSTAENSSSEINPFDGKYYDEANQLSYIISNTGRMYKLNGTDIKFFFDRYDESADAMFISGRNISDLESSIFIFKLSEQEGELKIEKLFDLTSLPMFASKDYFVDNYGNIFSMEGNIIVKTGKSIQTLTDTNIYKAANGFVYCGEQVFDGNGELVESEFIPPTSLNCVLAGTKASTSADAFLVKSEGNTQYYYLGNSVIGGRAWISHVNFEVDNPQTKIFKYTFDEDGIAFTFEIIEMEDVDLNQDKKPVVANDKLYFMESSEIYYIDIETGAKTVLNSEYLFNSIWSDNKGNICFTGIDMSSMDSVSGTISPDGTVDIGITSNGYEVIYIKPIN